MSVTNSIYAIPATYINAATLDPILWQAVNPSGLPHACCLLRISNINKSPISISYDGVTENDVLDADSVLQIDLQDNKSPSNENIRFSSVRF